MIENSLVSIVVPVYNVEQYLRKCLNSIVNQTYQNIEIICVDDGSPDDSINILNEFAENDKRIKVIRQENQGLSGARNTGINNATGKYIMFVDSDDWIELNMVELMATKMEKENLDLVVCGNYNYYGNLYEKQELYRLLNCQIKDGMDYFKQNYYQGYRFANCWNKIYKLEILKENNFYFSEKRLYEDLLFVFKYLVKIQRIGIKKNALYHYIVSRENSITNKINKNDIPDTLFTLDEIEKFLKKEKREEILNLIEFREYIFFWISANSFFKLLINNKKYDRKKINKVINDLKNNKKYKEYANYILENSKNKNKKLLIWTLYFNDKLLRILIKLNYYKNNIKRRLKCTFI